MLWKAELKGEADSNLVTRNDHCTQRVPGSQTESMNRQKEQDRHISCETQPSTTNYFTFPLSLSNEDDNMYVSCGLCNQRSL